MYDDWDKGDEEMDMIASRCAARADQALNILRLSSSLQKKDPKALKYVEEKYGIKIPSSRFSR